MRITYAQLADLVNIYLETLAGGAAREALRLHAEKAEVNLRYINWDGPDRTVVYNVFKAAQGQERLAALVRVIREEGFELPLHLLGQKDHIENNFNDVVFNESLKDTARQSTMERDFPRLQISRYASYLSTSVAFDDPRFRLLEGRILIPSSNIQRVFLEASVTGAVDVVRVSIDVPPTGVDIPRLRMPRFTPQETERLTHTVVSAALNVMLYQPGIEAPVDSFQQDVWLSQPDVVLLARQTEVGEIEDYSPALAWWVNSGAAGIADFLAKALPLRVRQSMGYLANLTETLSRDDVDNQVQALYEGMQQLSLMFMPTELIWTAGSMEVLQRVRRPEEVLGDPHPQVNCLDGAILFASLLERMRLDPLLVLLPQHALAGWKRQSVPINARDPVQLWQTCGFIDTTLLSTGVGFDAAVSAAEGFILKAQDWFGQEPKSLLEFARVIDVKAARGLPPSGIIDVTRN